MPSSGANATAAPPPPAVQIAPPATPPSQLNTPHSGELASPAATAGLPGGAVATPWPPSTQAQPTPRWTHSVRRPRPYWSKLLVAALALALLLGPALALVLWIVIPPRVDFRPRDCVADEGANVETVEGIRLYDRIAYKLPDGTRIPFVLIRRPGGGAPPPFYIMRTKVTNRLFRAFAKANPQAVQGSQWEKGWENQKGVPQGAKEDEFPVFAVSAVEAASFTEWLGGELPTVGQWETAGGRNENLVGPFTPGPVDYQSLKRGDFALSLEMAAGMPMPVETARRDKSYFDCRDMASNGAEWTATAQAGDGAKQQNNQRVPRERIGQTRLQLCGQSYTADEPYLFGAVPDSKVGKEHPYYVSFRVVIPIRGLR